MRKDREADRMQSRRRLSSPDGSGDRESGDGHVFAREVFSIWSYLEGKNG